MKHFIKSYGAMTLDRKRDLQEAYIRSQFFLPDEIRTNPYYEIEPIVVLSGRDAFEYMMDRAADDPEHTSTNGDIEFDFIADADMVGVSIRLNKLTDERYIVYKLWTPFEKSNTKRQTPTALGSILTNRIPKD